MGSPQRIVSLVPSITEALAQLGAGSSVVGVTDYCLYPADVVASAARIGGTKNPDLDAIGRLQPDLVIANTDEQRVDTLDALDNAGYDVLVTETDSLGAVAETWDALGLATGREKAATRERKRLEAAVATAQARSAASRRLDALVPVWKDPWMATGGGTYIESLLAACGFDNVLATVPEKWLRFEPTVDATVAAAKRATKGPGAAQVVHALPRIPEVVLLPTEPYAFGDRHRTAFAALGVPSERVHVVDGELLTWWLSRSVDALAVFGDLHETLVAALAPD